MPLTTVQTEERFVALQQRIKQALADDFLAKKMELGELLAYLELLSLAENETQMRMLIGSMREYVPALSHVWEAEAFTSLQIDEKSLAEVIKLIAKTDPQRAGEIAKLMNEKGTNLEKVVAKYPELTDYLK